MTNHNAFVIVVFLIVAMNVVDFGMSYQAVSSGAYRELNPIGRLYLTRPVIAIPLVSVGNYGVSSALISLHGKSKATAWIAAGVLVLAHSFVIIHNARIMK